MAATSVNPVPTSNLMGLARVLVQHGRIKPEKAEGLVKGAAQNQRAFIDELMADGAISSADLAVFCAETFGHPVVDLNSLDEAQLALDAIDKKIVGSQRVVGLKKRGNKLFVALSDPTNIAALDQIKFQTQMIVEPVIVEHDKLVRFVDKSGQSAEQSLNDIMGDVSDLDLESDVATEEATTDASDVDDAPIVKFLQKTLIDAIEAGASDIHFEPYEKYYRIRFRIDGMLREMAQPPLAIKDKLVSRIKVLSRLNIAEKRVPQDGRMKLVLSKTRAIDFRVSCLPTLFGEKVVMRILDPSSAKLGIEALGYDPDQKEALVQAIHRPYGMVLVTGPTGSGKTVSLYTCLNLLNQPGTNISTAEDPAEINLPGINQVNVDDRAGLTFSAALKSFLRQDPDIIMVGEIRDLETADIAIKAAQTGHMVLATLHTNDAPTTLTRLMNMGVAAFNIASSIILITAQRLARRLCSCKQQIDLTDDALLEVGFLEEDLDGSWRPYGPVGCERCKGGGYKGRVGIYQVMPISEEIQRIILSNGTALDIAQQSEREGINGLRRAGMLKVKQGLTSVDEVLGVTNE